MGSIGSQFVGNVTIVGATTPNIDDLTLTLAATEYSYIFPISAKSICILNGGSALIEYAYTPGGKYMPLKIGQSTLITNLTLSGSLTIYFKTTKPAQVVKFEYWE